MDGPHGRMLGRVLCLLLRTRPGRHRFEGKGRIEAFSDGVFAIAITLLVLNVRLPDLPPRVDDPQLQAALAATGPLLLTYLISFLVIGSFWVGHHQFFRAVRLVDTRLLWLNLLLLLCVSFLPFPTSVLGSYGELAIANDVYAGSLALVGLAHGAMSLYAWRAGLLDPTQLDRSMPVSLARTAIVPLVSVIVILLAQVVPGKAAYGFLLIAVLNAALARLARWRHW